MAGRTHLQHALPVTFGYKAAVWLGMVARHRERLAQLRPRVLVGQFAGAAGTLASLGDKGLAVHDALMDELGLGRPPTPWHVARDGFAEAVSLLGLVTGTLAKIATDVMLMMQTEVGEAFEPFVQGRGASSTMPQKRNPISCEMILALAKVVRQQAGLMLDAMAADHERATGPWQLEWVAIPEAFIAASGALRHARFMLEGLIVDAGRMRRNLDLTGGLIVAEAVMMALAKHTGRQDAHDLVYGACRAALDSGSTLLAELERRPEVTRHLNAKRLAELTDPVNYLGSAPAMVDRALASPWLIPEFAERISGTQEQEAETAKRVRVCQAKVCPAWALDWRCKSFTGRVGSNREPEATARSMVRRETRDAGAARPCGEEARGEPQHRTRVNSWTGHPSRVSVPSNATPKVQPRLGR